MQQYSLFIKHDTPIKDEIVEKTENVIEVASVQVNKPKISLESDAAKKILREIENKKKEKEKNKNNHVFIESDFKLSECKICGNKRLERYGNVYLCKKCGSELPEYGILFGDKIKKGDNDK